MHVRDYTKGHPTVLANNHPIRHGSVVGIHNGIIVNDEEILARHAIERAEPDMTVDSEAIFALMELTRSDHAALEQLRGSMATAWIDERVEGRAVPRPRRRPPALDRPRPPRGLLRLDEVRARGRRGRAAAHAAQARGLRGPAAPSRAWPDRDRGPLPHRPLAIATTGCCRRCARRTRAPRASRSSLRSPPRQRGATRRRG